MNPLTNVRNIQNLNKQELERGVPFEQSWHQQYKESAWIFIGGLDYDLTEGDIICLFSQYGEVANINLVRDKKTGKSKGFAFLCYENQMSTVLSVDNLNSIKLCARTIRVDHVEEYRVPKMREDMAPEQQKLALEGCAPALISSPVSEGSSNIQGSDGHDHSSHKKHKRRDRSPGPSNSDFLNKEPKSSDSHKRRRDRSPGMSDKNEKEDLMSSPAGEQSNMAGCMVDGVLLPPRLFGARVNKAEAAPAKELPGKAKKPKKNKKEKKDDKHKKKKEKGKKKKKKHKRSNSTSSSSSSSSDDDRQSLRRPSRSDKSFREEGRTSSSPGRSGRRVSGSDLSSGRVKSEPRSDEDGDVPPSDSWTRGSSVSHGSPNFRSRRENHHQSDGGARERGKGNDREFPSNSDTIYRDKRHRDEKDSNHDKSLGRRRGDGFEDGVDAGRHRRDYDDDREWAEHNRKRWRSDRDEGRNSRDSRYKDGDFLIRR